MSDSDKTITYVAEVFGMHFVIQAKGRPQLRAHLVRRLRKEVKIRTADFEDGAWAARLGIETEVASATPDAEDDAPDQPPLV
jgi:hypothetical protein